jgi:hypothetical protein
MSANSTSTTVGLGTLFGVDLTTWVVIVSSIIIILTFGKTLFDYAKFKRYTPSIQKIWAEGRVEYPLYDPNMRVALDKVPGVYLSAELDPKDKIINNCEVEIGSNWYACFREGDNRQITVLRPETVDIGRYQIDIKDRLVRFQRPAWNPYFKPQYDSWLGELVEPKDGIIEVTIRGEVEGRRLVRKVKISLDIKEILKERKWREDAVFMDKQIVDNAERVFVAYLANQSKESSADS